MWWLISQIFVSHSRKDVKIRDFFGNIFGTTRVKGIFKEIEGIIKKPDPEEIKKDIQDSNAIFILLGKNVQIFSNCTNRPKDHCKGEPRAFCMENDTIWISQRTFFRINSDWVYSCYIENLPVIFLNNIYYF